MAAEEDTIVPSNTHHSLNDVAQQSTEDKDVQEDTQQTGSNNLEKEGDTELSKSVHGVEESTIIESHEQWVGMAEHTRTRSSHTLTPCKSSNFLKDVIMKATRSKPVCSVESRLEHVDPGLESVDSRNAKESSGGTSTGEFGEEDNTRGEDGKLFKSSYG